MDPLLKLLKSNSTIGIHNVSIAQTGRSYNAFHVQTILHGSLIQEPQIT